MKKVALALTGAVGHKKQKFRNKLIDNKPYDYLNYKACYKSINKYIINPNIINGYEFDIYIHCWNTDLKENFIDLYHPIKYIFEDNSIYYKEFSKIKIEDKDFNQLSKSLSHKKAIELIESSNIIYDHVIIYRPDILLWKTLNLKNYLSTNIYISGYLHSDFHFIMNLENAKIFKNLYDSAFTTINIPITHYWIYHYITNFITINVYADDILPRIHQDSIRKIYNIFLEGKISREELYDFEIDINEIKQYVEDP